MTRRLVEFPDGYYVDEDTYIVWSGARSPSKSCEDCGGPLKHGEPMFHHPYCAWAAEADAERWEDIRREVDNGEST